MAIKLYTGRMGSGKTYEVVTEVVLNGLRRGRRVVSNIAGLNYDEMRRVLEAEGIAPEKIGQLVSIDHSQVLEPSFWRSDGKEGGFLSPSSPPVDSFIQPGDLVALDEIWRFWDGFARADGDGKKRPAQVMNFFRMHRHFIHAETGVACDVALITQDVLDLSRSVRSVVEETYYMEKLTAVGMSSRYRVDIFQGGKKSRKPLRSMQRSYNKDLFCLYSSHSQKKDGGAEAVEENIDKRGNLLSGVLFKVILPLALLVGGFGVWVVWGFLHPNGKEAPKGKEIAQVTKQESGEKVAAPAQDARPEVSDEYRVLGWYSAGGVFRVVLSDGKNTRFIHDPHGFKVSPVSVEVLLPEGGAASSWSGGRVVRDVPGVKHD